MKKLLTSPLWLCVFPLVGLSQQIKTRVPQLGKAPLKKVIAAMTVEEKVKLIVGMGMNYDNIPDGILPPKDPADAKIPEKVPGAAGRTHAIPRLGIPSMTLSDGPAGVRIEPKRKGDKRTYYATAFPVATLLASSWDTSLVRRVGLAFGNEVLEYGIDVLLAPAMNIQRNPLGGRNFEYYSEDPVIAGNMAAYFVKGIQVNGVGTSIKHFAANNQEFNRMQLNTNLSERALREIYLKGFEIAVKKSNPWTVMSSYNLINGTYTSESRGLLTDILRNEWNFKGLVMTDWFGGKSATAQVNAGNDMLMPGIYAQTTEILESVKDGRISQQQLDLNVERILNIILKSPSFRHYKYSDKPNLVKHAQVSRMAADESMVLLKNDEAILPMANKKKVALFGNTSYDLIPGGTGSGDVNKPYVISLNQGLTNTGYVIDQGLQKEYKHYIITAKLNRPKAKVAFFTPTPISEMPLTEEFLKQECNKTDIAIITIGRNAGEGNDRAEANDFTLTDIERQNLNMVTDVFHANHKKVVVVLNIGGVTEIASWRDEADAILLAWQPGEEGGNAITDVLSGKVNPSGKLATTFPVKYSDVPSAKTFPGKLLDSTGKTPGNPLMGQPAEVTYDEGIYVGYRYYNTFNIKPAYEFGYGLSYTKFKYHNIKISGNAMAIKPLTVTVDITNTGKVAGKEVVQLYISAPVKQMDKPTYELKAFAKTALLQPGKTQTLTFTIAPEDLASFNTNKSSWIADSGNYTIKIGASSLQIKQTVAFKLAKDVVVEKVKQVLTPKVKITEIR
ncbi:glycoside hydrolase family 3 protein [Mucilaginibacter sp. L196]|uniref:beta-glucosidase n=1 Tax=Mucilaginibacter sp. L196 TaxID=1641870 RepID=UPI00131BE89B|nr:glycoside hydrolase family 3 C-terminal domain-containing protein [Mucilaginibacter sp. L196]